MVRQNFAHQIIISKKFIFIKGNAQNGRFFIVVYNSTSVVSAAYATLIALAIAGIIGALLGGLYYLLLSAKSEMSSYGSGYESNRFFKSS